ncbi:hypothetical protein QTP86_019148 [Hemibagrus guttatus]|nr:hypothetical protein QTP86_019148 [Hemibagrus guttatus]
MRVLNYLDDWLTLAHSKAMAANGARAYEVARPQDQPREVCAFSISENHLPGSVLGFHHDAGMSIFCLGGFHTVSSKCRSARPEPLCRRGAKSPQPHGGGSQRDSFVRQAVPVLAQSGSPLARLSLVRRPCLPPRQHSFGDSHQGRSPLSGTRGNSPPPPGDVEAQFLEAGLSLEVVETLLNARAPSTRKLYALKWRLFSLWCAQREQDPMHCPIGTVLCFLQSNLSRGLSPSTLKVYVAAIAANHALVLGATLGRHLWSLTFCTASGG